MEINYTYIFLDCSFGCPSQWKVDNFLCSAAFCPNHIARSGYSVGIYFRLLTKKLQELSKRQNKIMTKIQFKTIKLVYEYSNGNLFKKNHFFISFHLIWLRTFVCTIFSSYARISPYLVNRMSYEFRCSTCTKGICFYFCKLDIFPFLYVVHIIARLENSK